LVGIGPPPVTMACWGFCPPSTAASTGLAAAAFSVASPGAPSSSRASIVVSISTWPISSVAMSMIMSLYLPGTRHDQPCQRYCIITVISPNWPPTSSWSFAAKNASGFSGLAWNCRWSTCLNISCTPLEGLWYVDGLPAVMTRQGHPWPGRAGTAGQPAWHGRS
jgi:hypothetical protein